MGQSGYGIDPATLKDVVSQIMEVRALGVEIAVVVGGGNIYRGMRAEGQGIDRVTGDYMGMLATLMNGLALENALKRAGQAARVFSALAVERVAAPFDRKEAVHLLEEGKVLIFVCGTGNPFFTTDTAAALRALEVEADILLKATKVDGVYDKDPEVFPDAMFYPEISYEEALGRGLKVMDATAFALCMDNGLPIGVFNLRGRDNLRRVVLGDPIGTIVRRKG